MTTFTVSQLGAATVVAGGSLSDITGLIDRRDGSVLVSGTGKYAITDSVAKAAVNALNKHNSTSSFEVGNTTVSALPANGVAANGLDLDWLGVVTQGPLPESGMSAALQPAIVALAVLGLASWSSRSCSPSRSGATRPCRRGSSATSVTASRRA